jgi:hypothetical protein
MTWQPIETAPKDDKFTRILLRFDPPFSDSTEPGIAVGAWSDHGWYLTCIWASSSAHREPTHWAPLPT